MISSFYLYLSLLLVYLVTINGYLAHGGRFFGKVIDKCDLSVSKPSTITTLFAARGKLGSEPLELCEENVQLVFGEIRQELGTIFGYDPASKEVGITGEINYEDIDGGNVIVSLKGRFWHATDTVMMRVESFLKQRIPEIIEVVLDKDRSSIVDDNRLNTEGMAKSSKKLF